MTMPRIDAASFGQVPLGFFRWPCSSHVVSGHDPDRAYRHPELSSLAKKTLAAYPTSLLTTGANRNTTDGKKSNKPIAVKKEFEKENQSGNSNATLQARHGTSALAAHDKPPTIFRVPPHGNPVPLQLPVILAPAGNPCSSRLKDWHQLPRRASHTTRLRHHQAVGSLHAVSWTIARLYSTA